MLPQTLHLLHLPKDWFQLRGWRSFKILSKTPTSSWIHDVCRLQKPKLIHNILLAAPPASSLSPTYLTRCCLHLAVVPSPKTKLNSLQSAAQQLPTAFRIMSKAFSCQVQPLSYFLPLDLIFIALWFPWLHPKMSHWDHAFLLTCFLFTFFSDHNHHSKFPSNSHTLPTLPELFQMPLPPGSILRLPRQKSSLLSSDLIAFYPTSPMTP